MKRLVQEKDKLLLFPKNKKKNNTHGKDYNLDSYCTKTRALYEIVFA